ncbi:MAG: hypothetical protein J6B90_00520 [Lachnospiraceae bacterium]|nr:hypothetical protein [Lachnospiraceae bacterium]
MLLLKKNKDLEEAYVVCLKIKLDNLEKTFREIYAPAPKDKKSSKTTDAKEAVKEKASLLVNASRVGRLLREIFKNTGIKELDDINDVTNKTFGSVKDKNILYLEKFVCLPYEDIEKLRAFLKNRKKADPVYWEKEVAFLKKLMADYLYDALVKGVNLQEEGSWKSCTISYTKIKKYLNSKGKLKINNLILGMQGVKGCPYCNGQYIDNRDDTVVAQLDHLFAKALHPHLALCLYNLVPSCSNCNKIKLDSPKKYQSPYDEKYKLDSFKFKLDIDEDYISSNSDFELQFAIDGIPYSKSRLEKWVNSRRKNPPIAQNLVGMKIAAFYTARYDKIEKIIENNKWYIKEWKKTIEGIEGEVSAIQIEEQIFGKIVEDDDLVNQPFSKLERDIMEDLKIIERKSGGGYVFR